MFEWPEVRVKDLFNLGRGRVISGIEISANPGHYPVFSSQSSSEGRMGSIGTYDFEGEYVTWTTDGANAGTVFHRSGQFNCTNVCGTLKAKNEDEVSHKFMAYQLSRLTKRHVSYVGNPKLMNGVMAQIKLFHPPFAEQKQVANILDTLDTQIRHTEAIIAKLQQVKQGLLHDLLTRGIDENGQLRPPYEQAPELYKESPLGWIPKEWEVSTIGKEFQVQLGKMLDAEKNTGFPKPYIGNKAVQWGRIDISEMQNIKMSGNDLIRFRLQEGDILVCEGGEVGRAAIWDAPIEECYYQKALHRLRAVRGFEPQLLVEFLFFSIKKDFLSEYISKTSIAHLTKEKLAQIPLPVPKKSEQVKIVSKLIAHKTRLDSEYFEYNKLINQKAGLMDDLLTGRVRVTELIEQEKQAS